MENLIITAYLPSHVCNYLAKLGLPFGRLNNSHEQLHTTSFVIPTESNLRNRGYFCNLLFQPTQSKLLDNLLNKFKWEWS